MFSRCVLGLSMVFAAGVGGADDKPKEKEIGLPPRFTVVTELDRKAGEVTLQEQVMRLEPVEVEQEVVKDGEKVKEKVTIVKRVIVTQLFKIALKYHQAFDGEGKKVATDDLLKRLEVNGVVLLASDFKEIDAAYLKLLRKDALIFVPLKPEGTDKDKPEKK
jgi:hypothetical protein